MSLLHSLSARHGRRLMYLIPLALILYSIGAAFNAVRNEATGVAWPTKNYFSEDVVTKAQEPEIFRERTNRLWALSGITFSIGSITFIFVRKLDRYISNDD